MNYSYCNCLESFPTVNIINKKSYKMLKTKRSKEIVIIKLKCSFFPSFFIVYGYLFLVISQYLNISFCILEVIFRTQGYYRLKWIEPTITFVIFFWKHFLCSFSAIFRFLSNYFMYILKTKHFFNVFHSHILYFIFLLIYKPFSIIIELH